MKRLGDNVRTDHRRDRLGCSVSLLGRETALFDGKGNRVPGCPHAVDVRDLSEQVGEHEPASVRRKPGQRRPDRPRQSDDAVDIERSLAR